MPESSSDGKVRHILLKPEYLPLVADAGMASLRASNKALTRTVIFLRRTDETGRATVMGRRYKVDSQ
jgi:hypothetical protein